MKRYGGVLLSLKKGEIMVDVGNKRFETIFESSESTYQEGSKVLIERISLLKDNNDENLYVRCLFRSLTEQPIKALLIKVMAKDIWGNLITGVDEYQLLDLKTKIGDVFGQTIAILLPDKNTRSVEVSIKKVLYEDGSMIDVVEAFEKIEKPKLLIDILKEKEVVDQYIRDTSENSKYFPVEFDGIWRCSCGVVNLLGAGVCFSCKVTKDKIFGRLDYDNLKQRSDEFIAAEKEKAEKERERQRLLEEAERRKKQEEEERQRLEKAAAVAEELRRKMKRKRIILAVFSLIVILAAGYATIWHIIPMMRYNMASNEISNNNYDAAYEIYSKLDYKDSADKAIETRYLKGEYLISQEKFSEAADVFEKIPTYRDSNDKYSFCKTEARYHEGIDKCNSKDYEGAIEIFRELGNYSDAANWINKTNYAHADNCFKEKDYEEAAKLFWALGSFGDANERAKESEYQKAIILADSGDYEGAIEIFNKFSYYSDSMDKLKQTQYTYGKECYEGKEYLKAYELLSALGVYEDAKDLSNIALYKQAGIEYKAKRYDTAFEYYYRLPADYKDSLEKAKESGYLFGCQCLEDKDYLKASNMFGHRALVKYGDSSDKYNESTYLYAQECLGNKKYNDAISYFGRIINYKDSEKMVNESRYQLAMDCMETANYIIAVTNFEKLESYRDSKSKLLEAKYKHVKKYYNNTNGKTYEYLKDLKAVGYSDSKKLFNELYAWKVTNIYFNTSSNSTLKNDSISKYSPVYCHFTLEGGEPGGATFVYCTVKRPNGSKDSKEKTNYEYKNGSSGWWGWADGLYENPMYGASGTLTFTFYDDKGNTIGSGSVKII